MVVAPSRLSLGQSAFGQRRQSVGPFGVNSKRSSHVLSLVAFHFGTGHCEHNRLGIQYCTIYQGLLLFRGTTTTLCRHQGTGTPRSVRFPV